MGFWSSVGSAVSGACSAIGSAFSSACSAIGGAFSAVFSSVAKVCSGVVSLAKVLPLPGMLGVVVKAVTVLDAVFKVLGLLKPDEKTEELGDRVVQAHEAGIRPERFDSYDEYMQEIRAFELDPEKSEKITQLQKITSGLAVQTWGVEEKFGEGAGELVPVILKDHYRAEGEGKEPYLTSERMGVYLDAIDTVKDVAAYFSGSLDTERHQQIEEKLVAAEKLNHPEKTEAEIYTQLDECTRATEDEKA